MDRRLALTLGVVGLCVIGVLAWQALGLPLNKGLWTGSYVLFTSGAACLALLAALAVVEAWGVKGPLAPLVTFGTNPLLAFVLSGLLAKTLLLVKPTVGGVAVPLQRLLFEKVFSRAGDPHLGSHLQALALLAAVWAVLRLCERRGWYWKV